MFSGFDETNKQRITLKDVDPIALEILVSFPKKTKHNQTFKELYIN